MSITATYSVIKENYYNADTKHNATLVTTEYTYKNTLLVHLLIGRNLGISISNMLSYHTKKEVNFQNEQFFTKKTYSLGKPKQITRSTFDEKLKGFDMSNTLVEQEILEEYSYTDNAGHTDTIQIVIRIKNDIMSATVDFKDSEQYQNFVCPVWLVRLNTVE